ncbi:MAG: molecular chaperone [Thermodesulfovibrionales bacterium]
MIEELREELYLYNLLRQLFLKEPTKDLINELSKIDLTDETDDDISYGLKLLIESIKKNKYRLHEWIEDLAIEYARLFIGPQNPPAVPYASFYLSESRALMTEETIDVRRRYLEAGMAVKELYSIPDDHIGIELEFVYYLTQSAIEYFENGNREESSRIFEMRKSFLIDHMTKWIPPFVDKILKSSQEDFYKGIAYMLRGVLNPR